MHECDIVASDMSVLLMQNEMVNGSVVSGVTVQLVAMLVQYCTCREKETTQQCINRKYKIQHIA